MSLKYDSPLELPHSLTHQHVRDNTEYLSEVDANDINSYKVGQVYILKFKRDIDNCQYFKYRVTDVNVAEKNLKLVVNLGEGQIPSRRYRRIKLPLSTIEYAYNIAPK
jgi:hypothetical protein